MSLMYGNNKAGGATPQLEIGLHHASLNCSSKAPS